MPSPRPLRLPRFRSLYVGVLLAMVTTLSLSFLVFRAISNHVERITIDPVFDNFDELQLESARGILTSGGTQPLAGYLKNLDRIFGGQHYLLNGSGIDLVSGENRAAMLPVLPAKHLRIRSLGLWVTARRSQDASFWFVAVGGRERYQVWTFLPYYFLVLGATGLLCWLASIGVISPIRRIAASIRIFGQGDLSVRVDATRPDEIGQLGHSFNQMAERLQRLIVSERRLLADISHELRSPLARLKFAVKLARTSEDKQAAFDRIDRDVDRITALIAGIVEITFAEADPAISGTEVVSVTHIVDEVIHACVLEAEIKGCLIIKTGELSGDLLGNRELLRRAIENVLRNSIRYAPSHTNLDFELKDEEGVASISIRDYGPGVPAEMLDRIFDPFFRVEEAREGTAGRSGLGLSIAKRAVEVHHGVIAAKNTSPGLQVTIQLPLFPAQANLLIR